MHHMLNTLENKTHFKCRLIFLCFNVQETQYISIQMGLQLATHLLFLRDENSICFIFSRKSDDTKK